MLNYFLNQFMFPTDSNPQPFRVRSSGIFVSRIDGVYQIYKTHTKKKKKKLTKMAFIDYSLMPIQI